VYIIIFVHVIRVTATICRKDFMIVSSGNLCTWGTQTTVQ